MKAHVLCEHDSRAPVGIPTSLGLVHARATADPGDRAPNEDSAGVFDLGAGRVVLAVADGAGGLESAGQASRLTIESLAARLEALRAGEPLREAVLSGVDDANEAVLELDVHAGSTFAAAVIEDDCVRSYQVGDSAILVAGAGGELKHQAVTHSPTGYALEAGVFDELQALMHAHRNLLSNMVGLTDLRVEVSSPLRLSPGDTVLVASDGLVDNLVTDEILDLLTAPTAAEALEELCAVALGRMLAPTEGLPSKPDDLTVLVWRHG